MKNKNKNKESGAAFVLIFSSGCSYKNFKKAFS